jgi:hypothetical protein
MPAFGQSRQRQFIAQMVVDPVMERAEFVLSGLKGQRSTELRVSAGTLAENNQVAGYGERHRTTEVLLYERQRQIDPGRHSGRGPDRTVAHENRSTTGCDECTARPPHSSQQGSAEAQKSSSQTGSRLLPKAYPPSSLGRNVLTAPADVLAAFRHEPNQQRCLPGAVTVMCFEVESAGVIV